MNKGLAAIFVIILIIVPIAVFGCKSKVAKEEALQTEATETTAPVEEAVVSQVPVTEPAPTQAVNQETIPPTASVPPSAAERSGQEPMDKLARNKEIQAALKAANFYTGTIDGKLGPKTKKAIVEFQKAKGLKSDGKVGPRTWAELEKYLVKQ